MGSIWEKLTPPAFAPLDGDRATDVLIVGGGIAGVLCAHRLHHAGVDCLLVEADRIGGGVTAGTTAKITLGHGLLYHQLIRRFGENAARRYLEAQNKAGEEYARLCHHIDCDYERKDAYIYSLHNRKKVKKEVAALGRLGAKATHSGTHDLPFEVAGAVRIRDQAQFHPLKFLYAIAHGLPICEHTKVTAFLPHKVHTNRGTIAFRKLIVATHFPIFNKHGFYSLKLYQHRSYVLALEGAPPMGGMYADADEAGLSFRTEGERLLLGGGGHRTGKQGGGWKELEAFAHRHYPGATIAQRWATQDCMTLDGVPYIGRYAKSTPDTFVATGFNKWGMTNAMVAATLLCDLVQDRPNPCAGVFSPTRSLLHPQLAVNGFESVVGLLTPTVPRCPHLGCALQYNRAEHSWDCPCHGSRFAEDGTLINNPATDDKRM